MQARLASLGFQLSTPTFEGGVRTPDGQVLLKAEKGAYFWWSDSGGTRIPLGNGRYIQPDLCGRVSAPDAFHATLKRPNVIVEVVDTHYPERETLFELLKLSTQNHIVLLHFIRAPAYSSYYSQLDVDKSRGIVKVRDVHVLVDGDVLINGVAAEPAPPSEAAEFATWYAAFEARTLLHAMRTKDAPR